MAQQHICGSMLMLFIVRTAEPIFPCSVSGLYCWQTGKQKMKQLWVDFKLLKILCRLKYSNFSLLQFLPTRFCWPFLDKVLRCILRCKNVGHHICVTALSLHLTINKHDKQSCGQGARGAMATLKFKDSLQNCNFCNRKSLQFSKVAPLLSVASSASGVTSLQVKQNA